MKEHWTNFLLALIFVVLVGIFINVALPQPPDAPMIMSAVAPYQGNAADGVTTTVNSMLVGGKTYTDGAQSFRTDTEGALYIIPAGPSTVTLSAGDPLPITGTIGTIVGVVDVDATGQGDVPITLDGEQITVADIVTGEVDIGTVINVVDVDATGQGDLPMVPFAPITEIPVTEIIGIDEQVDQFEYSAATELAFGSTVSGELLNATVPISGLLTEAGTLLIFDADPSVSLADANLATASWALAIGKVDIAAGDWYEEDSGGTGAVATFAEPIAFHAVSSLWIVYYHEGATQWNSLAGDNESLSFQAELRLDS